MNGQHALHQVLHADLATTPATTLSTVPTGGVIRPIELLMMNSTPK